MSRSQHLPPFQLDGELSKELSGLGERMFSSKGTVLFRRGDAPNGVYLLVSGEVRLDAGEGAAEFRRSCLPGCLLGLPATVRNHPYSLTAACLEDCECIRVSHDVLISFLRENQAFCLHVVEILANEIGELRSRGPNETRDLSRGMLGGNEGSIH